MRPMRRRSLTARAGDPNYLTRKSIIEYRRLVYDRNPRLSCLDDKRMTKRNSGIENENFNAIKTWLGTSQYIFNLAFYFCDRWRQLLASLGICDSQSRALFDQPIRGRYPAAEQAEPEEQNSFIVYRIACS